MPPFNHKTALHFKFLKKIIDDLFFFLKLISANRRYERNSRYTAHTQRLQRDSLFILVI